ncbi:MAG: aminopeptidase P family N-terminal domain-containing protein, partial [Nitrospinota bacterium]
MQVPYDAAKLDRLMEEAGADVLLAATRHNIRYLCGGYFYHFHERFTAMGAGQYFPVAGIPRG